MITTFASSVDTAAHTRTITTTTAAGTPAAAATTTVLDLVTLQPVRTVDPLGRVTSYRYDAGGRQTSRTIPDGLTTTTSHTAATVTTPATRTDTSPDGRIVLTTYDALGRTVRVTDNVTNEAFTTSPTTRRLSAYSYSLDGTKTTATDQQGRTVTTTLDVLGRQVQEVDLPPWATVFWYFKQWRADGTVDRIHDALRDRVRDEAGRDPLASAGIVDAQSVKGADTVGADSRGFDAGKKVNGRKRHIVVDTMGLLLAVIITTAAVQDRDGARLVLDRLRFTMPSVALVWADGGYAGQLVTWGLRSAASAGRDRAQTVGNQDLPRAAPPLGRRTHLRLDEPMPSPGPRLRTPARTLRSDDQMGHDRADDPVVSPRHQDADHGNLQS